jgi:protein-tyrosine phosphatase
VKSAGTEPSARIRLNSKMIEWADIIFVMEKKHKQRMLENFTIETKGKKIVILDIPDEFKYMDQELIEEIQSKVDDYIEQLLL